MANKKKSMMLVLNALLQMLFKKLLHGTVEIKLLLASGYASINEMNGFYGKEVFFSDGFDEERKFIL